MTKNPQNLVKGQQCVVPSWCSTTLFILSLVDLKILNPRHTSCYLNLKRLLASATPCKPSLLECSTTLDLYAPFALSFRVFSNPEVLLLQLATRVFRKFEDPFEFEVSLVCPLGMFSS
jgi:hypothetical protein